MESKTKHYGRRTYDMVNIKWKTVRPDMVRFCGVYGNVKHRKASINLNANVGDDKEDEVQEIRRPMGRDKVKDAAKKKGSRALGSSSMNDEALTRLMVTEMTSQEKEERLAFLNIKRREVKCSDHLTRVLSPIKKS
nr:hypothetical protein [Tanacetum cinerariifolium]